MTEAFTVEILRSEHDRTRFACGVAALDRYFREIVSQDIRRRLSNCFVAVDANAMVAGYYTFAATAVPLTELPTEQTKRLPRYPSVPAGLIGRLAVDRRFQGRGVGSLMVEGGGELSWSLVRAGVIDRIYAFIAPSIIGGRDAPTPVAGEGLAELKEALALRFIAVRRLGGDVLLEAVTA